MKLELEYAYWKSVASGVTKPKVQIFPYVPQHRQLPSRLLPIDSSWNGIEIILADIIQQFNLGTARCLEFGVEYGYSTAALSSFFESVIGIDTFYGDKHTDNKKDLYAETGATLAKFENIELVRSDYRDWIRKDDSFYDLVHVDIVHTFADTFACGLWSAQHSTCTIFHDTESFPEVKKAVKEISRRTEKKFYNFRGSYGLGILV